MRSKNLFFSLMKEDFKRRLWVFTINCLAFFLSVIMVNAISISLEMNQNYGAIYGEGIQVNHIAIRNANIVEGFSILVSKNNIFLGTFFLILALVGGISGFRYVQKKKSVDFFHSLPIRRETLFFVTVVNSILMVAVPYLVSTFISAVFVLLITGDFSVFLIIIRSFIYYISLFMLAYMTVVPATLFTGNVVLAVFVSGMLTFYIPVAAAVIMWYTESFFATSYIDWNYVVQVTGSSSGFLLIYPISGLSTYTKVLVGLAGSAVLGVISLYVYKLRASESSDKSVSFKAVKAPIKMLIVILLSVFVAKIFYDSLYDSLVWAIFGIVISSLISHCAIEAVYNSDFKKLFDNLLHLPICLVVAMVFFFTFYFDLIGYDRYVPSASSLESGGVFSRAYEENFGFYTKTVKERDKVIYWDNYSDALRTEIVKRMEIKDKELFLELSKRLVDEVRSDRDYFDYRDSAIILCYNLKGGRQKLRRFRVSRQKVDDILMKIHDDEGYKKGLYPILETKASDIVSFDYNTLGYGKDFISNNNVEDKHIEITDKELGTKLIETYKNELLKFTAQERNMEYPVATIRFNNEESERVLKEYVKEGKGQHSGLYAGNNIADVYEDVGYYPIYPTFENTIKILEAFGVAKEASEFDLKNVEGIKVYMTVDNTNYEEIFYEKEQMKELLKLMINADLPYGNTEYMTRNGEDLIVIRILVKNEGELQAGTYILGSLLPDFVKKRLESYKK